jgi:hypothetical protein
MVGLVARVIIAANVALVATGWLRRHASRRH